MQRSPAAAETRTGTVSPNEESSRPEVQILPPPRRRRLKIYPPPAQEELILRALSRNPRKCHATRPTFPQTGQETMRKPLVAPLAPWARVAVVEGVADVVVVLGVGGTARFSVPES